jgi:methyl-CpG-binding domain protein 4
MRDVFVRPADLHNETGWALQDSSIIDVDMEAETLGQGLETTTHEDGPETSILEDGPKTPKKTRRKKTDVISPHFGHNAEAKKSTKAPAGTKSIIAIPPLSSPTFGLIQEEFAFEPFKLIVAVIFLNQTRSSTMGIPALRLVLSKWPTVESFASANIEELRPLVKHLGFGTRADTLIAIARKWQHNPPVKNRRYRTKTIHYPYQNAGKEIRPAEVLSDDDPRVGAFEIAHIDGLGPYAWDSWRIFCRDVLRGVASGFNGEDADDGASFEPEWKRVSPGDKELRAFLRWMWLREGIFWDPETGEKLLASEDLMRRAEGGQAQLLGWDEEKALLVGSTAAGSGSGSFLG